MKFVSLSREQLSELDAVMRSKGCDKRTFKRLQSIKLNATGYSILQIIDLLGVHYKSAYNWISRYEKEGVAGLKDKPKSGRPPILTEKDKDRVEAFIQETPQQPKVVLARVETELGKTISRDTLRRVLKDWIIRIEGSENPFGPSVMTRNLKQKKRDRSLKGARR